MSSLSRRARKGIRWVAIDSPGGRQCQADINAALDMLPEVDRARVMAHLGSEVVARTVAPPVRMTEPTRDTRGTITLVLDGETVELPV